jgi:hypothetical protein
MATAKGPDAIQLLTDDHKNVKKLFKSYQALVDADGSDAEKEAIASQICMELTVHAQVEEEIFYPAVREAIDDDDLMDEAEVEHSTAKDLIAQIEASSPADELYDAKVVVLGEYVDHHVKEEQDEMFPKARKKIDVQEVGAALVQRKQELMAELGAKSNGAPSKRKAAKEPSTAPRQQR